MIDQSHHRIPLARSRQHVAGQCADIGQCTGLDVRPATDAASIQTPPHGAIGAGHGQRGDKLRHDRRREGCQQQSAHAAGTDALQARQPGTVLDHQFRHRQTAALKPGTHQTLGAFHAAGLVLEFNRQRQVQLACHDVVAEFVDIAHHLGQTGRLTFGQHVRIGRHRPFAHDPAQHAAGFGPHLPEQGLEILIRRQQADRPVTFATAARIHPLKHRARRV